MPRRSPDPPLSSKVFHVLLALGEAPHHGYGLKKAVRDRTAGMHDLDPGGLYRLIARLERDGWIRETESPASDDDPRRRYYALTPQGRAALQAEARRISALASSDDVIALARSDGGG